MNWDQVEGKWKQLKGSAKEKWGDFTDDDLETIAGKRDKLVGKLQERYGYAREQAQKTADEWIKSVKEPAFTAQPPVSPERGSEHHTTRR